MRFTYDPESKIQERVGQVTVAALLVAVLLVTAGCSDSNGDEVPTPTTEAQVEHGTPAARTAQPQPEPTSQPVESTPVTPQVVAFGEAEAAFREKRYGESTELFASYTGDKPDNPWGHYMLGLAAWKNGELDRAEQSLRRTLELDRNHVKSYINLGRVLIEQGRPEEARDVVLEAVDIDPVSTDGYRVLGLAYDETGETDSAIIAYQEALKLDSNDAWSMNNLGLLFIREGRFEDALGPLTRAVELRDDVGIFHNNLGMALERTGYFADAADEYELALAATPDHTKATTNLERVRELSDPDKRVNRVELAQAFSEEIQRWRDEEVASVEVPETPDQETPEQVVTGSDTGGIELETDTVVPTVDTSATQTAAPDTVTTNAIG